MNCDNVNPSVQRTRDKIVTRDVDLNAFPPVAIPFLRRTETSGSFQTESLSVQIPEEFVGAFPRPEVPFLAVWIAFLWRFTEQSEIALACFDDTTRCAFPLKATLSDELSLSDLIEQVETAWEQSRQSQRKGIDTRFAVGFRLESSEPSSTADCRFHLMLSIRSAAAMWSAGLIYDPASLSADSVDRMRRSFETLLKGSAQNPKATIYALPILPEGDRHQVTVTFNETAAFYPAEKCIHQLFEDQVERTPDRIAVCDRSQNLSYRELNERANRIAHLLRRHGAGPNVPIGLYVDRSVQMISGLLAILKSGACYVPLIPADPAARVSSQLAQTKPPIVLTKRELVSSLPELCGEIICLDEPFDAESEDNPDTRTTAEDLVYVLFTSGSTGVPKGVAVRHRNLVNYTYFICRQLGLQNFPEGWHFATVSTLAADLGNTSVFGSLISGGCLHVIDYETAMSPENFAAYVKQHPMDLLKIAPSHLAALLKDSKGDAVLPKHFVVVGGERLSWELLREVRSRSNCSVMNHYGPTETTVGCCTLIVREEDFSQWEPAAIPLARPIANDRIYILDRLLRPVPVGVPGELNMAGAGLSRGYFNQPELTAERFVSNPFSTDPSDQIYRTGDLGRFLPNGMIEFLGRVDHQIKIRGFRVEPAELEAALMQYPGIEQAVALPSDNQNGERILVAYISTKGSLYEDELRRFLSKRIPDYMLPSKIEVLDQLPLNANGKIDLRALPQLAARKTPSSKPIAEPATPAQEKLKAIWLEVLKLDSISIDDNFFALGGHSLLAIQMIARIRKTLGIDFPLRALLENPTIRAAAARLNEFPRLAENEEQELTRLLHEIADTSDEEAERILALEKEATDHGR